MSKNDPPNIVYHYTSPQGAFDILRNKTLWFTDCQYLNDMSEFVYILEPIEEAYTKLTQERGENASDIDRFLKSFFSSPYEGLDFEGFMKHKKMRRGFPPRFRYYVLCSSINDDSASMWNYYVRNGSYRGYNLGLRRAIIIDWFHQLNNDKIKLVEGRVIYDRKKQVDKAYQKLKELLACYDNKMVGLGGNADDSLVIDDFQDGLSEYIHEQKLFSKNPAFASEQEHRFVLKVHNDYSNGISGLQTQYRVGESGIITPYIEWNFGDLKAQLLNQITLSPMIESELAHESFKRFLANDVYQSIEIKPSTIKLRY
ncbi:MAG: DUF2971 domain-containing protein [Firmicutes bacterium]|nr:DUF2971 domain-containing protein [Bacillota bacterium]